MDQILTGEQKAILVVEERRFVQLADERQILLGSILNDLRSRSGKKLLPFAVALSPRVAVSFVSEVEAGDAKLPDGRVLDWARCLGVSAPELAAWCLYTYRPYHFFRLADRNPDLSGFEDIHPLTLALQTSILGPKAIAQRISQLTNAPDEADTRFMEQSFTQGSLLGSYIRTSRNLLGLWQRDVALNIGYSSPSTVSAIEADRLFIQDGKMGFWETVLQLVPEVFYSLALRVFMPGVYSILSGVNVLVDNRRTKSRSMPPHAKKWIGAAI